MLRSSGPSRWVASPYGRLAGIILFALALATIARGQLYFWSNTQTNPPAGGSGTWNLTGNNWELNGKTTYGPWPNVAGYTAAFEGGAGTVTLGADGITATSMDFLVSGYTIAGGGHSLNASAINIVANASATISAPIVSTGFLSTDGPGTLNVTGGANITSFDIFTNSPAPNITSAFITGGTMNISAPGGIPAIEAGGTIESPGANLTISGGAVVNANPSAMAATDVNEGSNLTISGSGTRLHSGAVNLTSSTVTVQNSGSLLADGAASIGNHLAATTGALMVLSGGSVSDASATVNGLIGVDSVVTGSGSKWTNGSLSMTAGSLDVLSGASLVVSGTTSFTGNDMNLTANGGTYTTGALSGGTTSHIILTDPTGAHALTINGASGSNTFSGAINGTGSVVKQGNSVQIFAAANTYTGGTVVNGGQLVFASATALPANTALSIGPSGTAQFASGIGAQRSSSLTISTGGKLDLTNNSLQISYAAGNSPVSTIRAYLTSGYDSGKWDGSGIASSTAASANATIGYADSADGVVQGQPTNTVLVKYTIPGDANLDGTVNFTDLVILAQHYGKSGMNWDQGDFDYDGTVAFADLASLAQHYGQTLAPAVAAVSVPEPSTAPVVALCLAFIRRRRFIRS